MRTVENSEFVAFLVIW